ncbi:MAG TPA: ADP-ribosylglycohydrolase family protein [Phototrophicaceae bacterium]|nr:ADP-ribosylglycohydrolase family protein [Phototrophicaceae bacterium]
MSLPPDHEQRLARARLALEGLSVGDAFGDDFEFADLEVILEQVQNRELPPIPWHFTDDTNMALSIFENLRQYGQIDQDALAISFANHYEPSRSYGAGAFLLLHDIKKGGDWRVLARQMFKGAGSYGNGGAMRIAPLGAYFASDDMEVVIEQAKRSAEITHTHLEGIAGAIVIAVATAIAWRMHETGQKPDCAAFIDAVLPHIPPGEVQRKCQLARDLPAGTTVEQAVKAIGSGHWESAQASVPFALWCAAEHLYDYEEAIWQTASGGIDVDTTCAMVGGIVAMVTDIEGIPSLWIKNRETLPEWAFVG